MSATAEAVRERPILFSGPRVKAILDGRKTQTRRALRPQPDGGLDYDPGMVSRFALLGREVRSGKLSFGAYEGARPLNAFPDGPYSIKHEMECPYGAPGDLLWVRESHWRYTGCAPAPDRWAASPDGNPYNARGYDDDPELRMMCDHAMCYRVSARFMPRWASRLTLRVTEVRVERVQEIGEDDAIDEGCDRDYLPVLNGEGEWSGITTTARDRFRALWDSFNAKRGYGWDANPYVWVISFERVATQPGGAA